PFAPITSDFGICLLAKNLVPGLQVSRHIGISLVIPLQTRCEYHESRCRAKAECRRGFGRSSLGSERLIETPQSLVGDEVSLQALTGSCHCVKIGRQPSSVFFEELENKLCRRFGTGSDQALPFLLGVSSTRND